MKRIILLFVLSLVSCICMAQASSDAALILQDSLTVKMVTYNPTKAFNMHKAIINSKLSGFGFTANELFKSNGSSGSSSSNIFSPSSGNLDLGTSSLSGDRTISALGSGTYSDLIFKASRSGTASQVLSVSNFAPNYTRITGQTTTEFFGTTFQFTGSLLGNGNTKIGIVGGTTPARRLEVEENTSTPTGVLYTNRFSSIPIAGTVTAGFGTGLEFAYGRSNSNPANIVSNTIESISTNVGAGTEASDLVFKGISAGTLAEKFRIKSTGDVSVGRNLSANNLINGYTTTVTSATTTTLTVSSTEQQYFTGSTTQTVLLPVTSTLVLGQGFYLKNNSTGIVTVQSSGGNTLYAMDPSSILIAVCISLSGTSAASWDYNYYPPNPMTTVGDLIYGGTVVNGYATPTRLAASTSGYALTSNGAGIAPSWQAKVGHSGLTANQIMTATSSNTIGGNTDFTWNESTKTFGFAGSSSRSTGSAMIYNSSGTGGFYWNNFSDLNNLMRLTNTGQLTLGNLGFSTTPLASSDVSLSAVGLGTTNGTKQYIAEFYKLTTNKSGFNFASKEGTAYIQGGTTSLTQPVDLILGGLNSSIQLETLHLNNNGFVGIGVSASSIPLAPLQVVSTTGGIMAPTMTTTQKNAIAYKNAQAVYDSTLQVWQFREGTLWKGLGAQTLSNSATLDFPSTTVGVNDLTITVTGAVAGNGCRVGAPNGSVTSNGIFTCWVSSTNTVTVRFLTLGTGEDPASGTFIVYVDK